MINDVDDFLAHFGVKGMKWGIRREENLNKTKTKSLNLVDREIVHTAKLKNGGELTVVKAEISDMSALTRMMARISPGYKKEMTNAHNFLLTDKNGVKVGEANFTKYDDKSLYLEWIGVDKKHRRQGYAKAAMQGVIHYAQDNNLENLYLTASKMGAPLYEQLGFKPEGKSGVEYVYNVPKKKELSHSGLDIMSLSRYIIQAVDASVELNDDLEQTDIASVDNFLAHYGVKGMRWGITKNHYREYQEKASTDSRSVLRKVGTTASMTRYFAKGQKLKSGQTYDEAWYASLKEGKEFIEKGASLDRVVRAIGPDSLKGRVYVSTLASDSEMYKAVIPAIQTKKNFGAKNYHSVYQVSMETKKRLTLPSEKARIDTFIDTIKTPAGREWLASVGYKDQVDEFNAKMVGLAYYKKFNRTAGSQTLKVNDEYFKRIRKQGYDALLDDNDAGVWSKKPTILLNAQSTVRVTDVKQLSAQDINDAQKKVLAARSYEKNKTNKGVSK